MARRVEAALAKVLPQIDVAHHLGLRQRAVHARVVAAGGRRIGDAPATARARGLAVRAWPGSRGITACTPNESEVEAWLGVRINEDRRVLERAGRTLLDRLSCEAVLITRGSRGMALFERDRPTVHIPIVGSDQVTDVTGAGDTVIATFSVALAAGASFFEAAHLSNYAGGVVVMKRGTATVSPDELRAALSADSPR